MSNGLDQRAAHRLPMHLSGFVDRHSDPRPTPISVGDLSVGGCLLIGWSAPAGTKARLAVELRDGLSALQLRVTVMRQTTTDDNRPAAGVRFEEPFPLSAENRLSQAIRMLEREAARHKRQAEEDAMDREAFGVTKGSGT